MKNYKKIIATLAICLCLSSCGTYFNQPFSQQPARIGEFSKSTNKLLNLPSPKVPLEVAVYNFSDQTGQYKAVENGSTFSTAVTQGATSMLIKALSDSGYFVPLERENFVNLSTERNIINNTKQQYIKGLNPNEPQIDPLLYAGLILEGGIVSYDTNIVTGGAGARYFGVGGSARYRQDRITIYLRAVSTKTGEIINNIYVSKTILSQAVDISLFRFVKFQRLLEAETGFTQNEPVQLAVKDAIEKAVHDLIVEGIEDGYWATKAGVEVDNKLVNDYKIEKEAANVTELFNRFTFKRRTDNVMHSSIGAALINGDYINAEYKLNYRIGYKRYLNSHFNLNLNANKFSLGNQNIFSKSFVSIDANVEYTVLPFDKLSPYLFAGGGTNISNDFNNINPKLQVGFGLEYLVTERIGVTAYLENNFVFSDLVDDLNRGSKDDMYLRFGVGLNLYIGNYNTKKDLERAQERERKKELKQIKKDNIKKELIKKRALKQNKKKNNVEGVVEEEN